MAANPSIPRPDAGLLNPTWAGRPANEWYTFWQQLLQFVRENGGNATDIAELEARVAALEAEGATDAVIQGLYSVAVLGSLADGTVTLQLVGDTDTPGNTYYYGTGPTGVRGWSTIASAFTASQPGIELVTGADGVTDIRPDDDLEAVEGLSGTGFATRTASNAWATRTHDDGDYMLIVDGAGLTGDPLYHWLSPLNTYLVDGEGDVLVDGDGNPLISASQPQGMMVNVAADEWVTRSIEQGNGITVTNGDGVSANPTIAHADTSSVAELNSNNSGTVFLQDVAITFDTFGHVQTATAGTADVATALAGTFQPLDATLTALAGQNWAANALPIGSGADTLSQVSFAANTFPARASTGNLVAKSISDGSLSVLAGTAGTGTFLRGDGTASDTLTGNLSVTGGRLGVGVAVGSESILIDADNNTAASGEPSFLMRGTGGKNRAEVRAYGAGNVAVFQMALARGTVASPTAVQSGDILGAMAGRGHDGSAFTPSRVTFLFRAAENWTSTAQGSTCAIETTLSGSTTVGARIFIDGSANIGFRTTTQFGGGAGVIGVANATTVPTSNPTGGTVLYADGGAFKARGSSGTTTTMAAAEPHCGHCGADFAHEWENGPRYGYLAVCVRCMTRGRVSWAEQRGRWQSHAIPAFLALMAWRALERRWLRWRYNVRSLA